MRQCGDCQLCCKLVPVASIGKAANTKCQHQRHGKGCLLYPRHPADCAAWNCVWLGGYDNEGLSRPDRVNYVIDVLPDFVSVGIGDRRQKIPVVQVWCDAGHPDAYKDKGLLDYLDRRGAEGFAALIRYDGSIAFALFPPSMTGDGWQRADSDVGAEPEHTAEERNEVMRDHGLIRDNYTNPGQNPGQSD